MVDFFPIHNQGGVVPDPNSVFHFQAVIYYQLKRYILERALIFSRVKLIRVFYIKEHNTISYIYKDRHGSNI